MLQYSHVGDDGFISLLLPFKHDFEGHSFLDSKTLRSLSFLQQNLKIGYEILCSKESCQKNLRDIRLFKNTDHQSRQSPSTQCRQTVPQSRQRTA